MTRRFALAAVLFFLSGALGLGYELVWIRKAALVVGSSQIALATVLTSFFLGLGLGSLVVGRYLRGRRWSPLFVYGLFEAAIGLFALLFPFLFDLLRWVYGGFYPFAAGSPAALFLARFFLLFLLFLVPTFFMGGTLPLLLDGLVGRDRAAGSLTSLLYGLNVLGAVAGVLLTGYLAIPRLGMNGSSLAFGAGNLLIAAVALAVFRGERPLHPAVPGSTAAPRVPVFFVALAAISGFSAIGYQVAWSRYFGLFNVASVYRTAVLLAVYLLALALGSLVLAPLLTRRVRPLRVLAVAQALVPIFVFGCLGWWRVAKHSYAYGGLPVTGEVHASWVLLGETPDAVFVAPLLQTALVLLLPVTLLGAGLPALIAAATKTSRELRSRAGTLVFWNTLGCSAGGFTAGYLLIPRIGLGHTFLVLALLSLVLAVAAEWRLFRERPGGAPPTPVLRFVRPGWALSLVGLVAALLFAREDFTRSTLEKYGQAGRGENPELIDLVEGPLTTAQVLRSEESLYLVSGDVVMAAVDFTGPSTQALQGHVPALFYPRQGTPQRCLGIALGSGQSFGALLMYPVERLDIVDISREIVELSFEHFGPYNHGLARDERVKLWIDDGRHFVDRAADDQYDVVSMEPPPPTAEGVYSLYSIEFYRGVKRILRDGGVFMQWLPLYMVTPNDLRGIVKSQAELFPHTFVVRAGSYDFVVVSFEGDAPPRFRPDWIAERSDTYRRDRLMTQSRWPGGRYISASLMGVVSSIITGPEEIARMEAPFLFHDDDQRLSYSSGDREILRRYRAHDRGLIARLSFGALPITPFRDLARYFDGPIPVEELERERALTLGHFGVAPAGALETAVERFHGATDPAMRAHWAVVAARIHDRRLDKKGALGWIGKAAEACAAEPLPADVTAVGEIARNQIASFAPLLERWLAGLPAGLRESELTRAVGGELEAQRKR